MTGLMALAASEEAAPGPARGALEGLVERIAEGDQTALADLYDSTSRWVYGLVLRIVGEAQAAEEVTLDVYLQVWRRAGSYSPGRGSASSWVLTIARSRAIDRLRAGAAIRRHEESLERAFDHESPTGDPVARTAAAERRYLVAAAVSSLPEEQKRAIRLAYFLGLSHHEIAERLAEPLGTVKTRIRLGLMKLRGLLGALEERP